MNTFIRALLCATLAYTGSARGGEGVASGASAERSQGHPSACGEVLGVCNAALSEAKAYIDREEECKGQLTACDNALNKAQELITAQDLSIANLSKSQTQLLKQLEDSQQREAPLPLWMSIVIGVAIGVTASSLLK